jgi:uncharacterized DUF497 family protein
MDIEFEPAKDALNRKKYGVSLALADWLKTHSPMDVKAERSSPGRRGVFLHRHYVVALSAR